MKRIPGVIFMILVGLTATGCKQKTKKVSAAATQGLPVHTITVTLTPVAQSSEYVATIKSRHSATLQPQVDGRLIQIMVHSGDHVRTGQVMMKIDPRMQMATVASARATEQQKKALYDYNSIEIERQQKLFDAGITSRDAYDQARQAYNNSKADYEAAKATRKMQQANLAYYTIRAPFDGQVGDIPVHVGDHVTSSTVLTTVDDNNDMEAYIYVPTERATQVRLGEEVELTNNNGKLLEKTRIDFVSPQVDNTLQGILVKAPVHSALEILRNEQLIKAHIIWGRKPLPVVPVLAVIRLGGQSFVYVAEQHNGHYTAREVPVVLGNTVGNSYSILSGLKTGDKVIISGTQFLVNGEPILPIGS